MAGHRRPEAGEDKVEMLIRLPLTTYKKLKYIDKYVNIFLLYYHIIYLTLFIFPFIHNIAYHFGDYVNTLTMAPMRVLLTGFQQEP